MSKFNNSKLKVFRKKLNLTQVEISKTLNIPQSYYSDIELGKKAIRYHHIKILTEKYDLDPKWLLNDSENQSESKNENLKLQASALEKENRDRHIYGISLQKHVSLLNQVIQELEK